MSRLATRESHSCILLLSFPSAYYLSNPSGFHVIKAPKGRSLGGNVYIYMCVYFVTYIYISTYFSIHLCLCKEIYLYLCICKCTQTYILTYTHRSARASARPQLRPEPRTPASTWSSLMAAPPARSRWRASGPRPASGLKVQGYSF